MHNSIVARLDLHACSVLTVTLALALGACSKESKPVAEDPKAPPVADPGDTAPADGKGADESARGKAADERTAKADAKPQVSEESFVVELKPTGAYEVGQAGQVELVLEAKPPFKVNQDYPYSFALDESDGLSFTSMKLTKDAVKLEEKRATLSVPFTPSQAGQKTISGTFKFSVCTDEQCLIKKEALALNVDVN